MPTKAVLFGLDVRFRGIDKKIEEEKSKGKCYNKSIGKKFAFMQVKDGGGGGGNA